MITVAAMPRLLARRRVPLTLQSEAAECGLACLAMIAAFHGHAANLTELRQRWSLSLRGATLAQLLRMSRGFGLAARAVRLDLCELRSLSLPCVLHWNLDHFVVLEKAGRNAVVIADPACGRRRVPLTEADRAFTGIALELLPTRDFRRRPPARRLRLRDIGRAVPGVGGTLAVVLALSLGLQLLALLLPFYSQLVIDEVVISNDRDLLNLLALAFALLVAMQAALTVLRSWLTLIAATRFNLHWTVSVFRHLLRLPLDYFEKRHLGDVQSRFGSLASLQQLITRQFVDAIMDGLMAVSTFAVMWFYDTSLALLVLASLLACLLVKLLFFPFTVNAAQEALAAGARKDSFFLESVRGLLAVKSFGKEEQRETQFQNRVVAAWNAGVQGSRLDIWQAGITQLLLALQLILVIRVAAVDVMQGNMTIGMLVAFLAYRVLFTDRAATLIDRAFRFRLARVQLARLADIVHTDVEPVFRQPPAPLQGRGSALGLAVRQLSFCYADDGPAVLENLALRIEAGEHVVLTGPSGCGKTTLLKIMMGLLPPTRGRLLVNDRPLLQFGVLRFRQRIAAVMQDDRLFSGSLLDNIAFFDPQADQRRVRACARVAGIDATIAAMPMQYQTLVGDMGTTLSGGQRQRVLLARALYSRPGILFLDEYTSQLDAAAERAMCERLSALSVTVVAVAHRLESIRLADREIHLPDASRGG